MALSLDYLEHPAEGAEMSPPLLIAHGLYGSARNFNSIGRKLAADRRVVMVDMRNHGGSPWSDSMTYPDMAADLAEVVERLCDGKAVVLGHSMGGKASMALALSRPDLVEGLIVADMAPVTYDHSHEGFIDAMLSVDLNAVRRRSDADPMLAEEIGDPMLRSFLLQNLIFEEEKAQWRLNLAALKSGLPDLMGWPAAWPHADYDGPTLFLHGGASDYVTDAMHPEIRRLFPATEFTVLEGAGHWLHAERPDAFLDAIRDFLAV